VWVVIVLVCCAASSVVMFLPAPDESERPVRARARRVEARAGDRAADRR